MSELIAGLFDRYEWSARISPALIVAIPPAVALASVFPAETWKWPVFGALGVWSLLGILVANMVRDTGRRKQRQLFADWGGAPTTNLLRHRTAEDPRLHEHRLQKFAALTGLTLPTAEQERHDPVSADKVYEALTEQFREKTRDHHLVAAENRAYGFRRNLWSLKPYGLGLALASVLVTGWALAATPRSPLVLVSFAVQLGLVVTWLAVIRTTWVRSAADRYARQLISAATSL